METNHIADLAKYELPELKRKGFFRRWHYMPTQMAVSKKEYYFIEYEYKDLKESLENHQFNELKKLHCKVLNPIELVVVSTIDEKFAAAQIRRYQTSVFKPETEIMVFKDADAVAFLGFLKELKPDDKGYF